MSPQRHKAPGLRCDVRDDVELSLTKQFTYDSKLLVAAHSAMTTN